MKIIDKITIEEINRANTTLESMVETLCPCDLNSELKQYEFKKPKCNPFKSCKKCWNQEIGGNIKNKVIWNSSLQELINMNNSDYCSLFQNIDHVYDVEDECDEFYYLTTEHEGILGFVKERFNEVEK